MARAEPKKRESSPQPANLAVDGPATRSAARPVVYRSEGQRLLGEVTGSLSSIARSVGASKQSIAWWRVGEKAPGPAFRTTLQKVHGIPAASWDEGPRVTAARSADDALTPANGNGIVVPAFDGTTRDYASLIALHAGLLAGGQLRAADAQRSLEAIGKLREKQHREEQRAKKPVSDRDVVRSAAWYRIREGLGTALKPFPEALAAVLKAIKDIDE